MTVCVTFHISFLTMAPSQAVEYVSTLSPDVEKILREKLEEDESRRNDSIIALREWHKKQPHLQAMPTGKLLQLKTYTYIIC